MTTGIGPSDLTQVYGALNEIGPSTGLTGNRRATTVTDMISNALEEIYTPDALRDKSSFNGLLMASFPTVIPRQSTKQELFAASQTSDGTVKNDPWYYVYKVLIPEIDPRVLDFKNPNKGLTLLQRLKTFEDVILDPTLGGKIAGPIPPGTVVTVKYEDMDRLKNPKIIGVGVQLFSINLVTGESSIKKQFLEGSIVPPTSMTPIPASAKAKAFFKELKASSHFAGFSDNFLCGVTANAQKESGFKTDAAGDKRGDVGGNGALAIEKGNEHYCSFGYWQMNVCANGGGGQRFATFNNIDVNLEANRTVNGELYKAITNKDKLFKFMAHEMKRILRNVGDTNNTAEYWAQQIAIKFEICSKCKPVGHKSGKYSSTIKRGALAAGLQKELPIT